MLKIRSIHPKSQVYDPNLFLTLRAKDLDSVSIEGLTPNRAINMSQSNLIGTNPSIEMNNRSQKTMKAVPKAGNASMKKLGATLFNLFHHKKQVPAKKLQVEYSSIKQQIKQSSSRVLKSKHKVSNSQLLQVRSIQLDEELKQLHTKRQKERIETDLRHTNSSRKYIQSIQINQPNRLSSVPLFVHNRSSQDFHRKFQTEIKIDQKQKEKNGFYTKLKIKLKRQMQKIQAKKTQGKQNFLVQGCRLLKFDPEIQITRRPLTDRPRPQSSIARTGVQYQSAQLVDRDRRPKSSRSRTVQRKEIEYMSANADDIFKKKPGSRPRSCKRSLTKKGQFNFQSTMNKTLKHVSPLYLTQSRQVRKNDVRNEKIKEKMLTLLVDCDHQTNQYSQLSTGLRVFESFTNRMNKGLSEVSKMLQGAQQMSLSGQYAQFLEK